ncbi:hypothetical protein Q5X44_18015 [Acinetobacter baumannii]|nr:hypothetical protein [Acinetobacter baumannii]
MDNCKIKVKDEQNFKEVVSLINTLGYGINFSYSNASGEVVKGLFLKSNGLVEWTHRDTYFDLNDSKELTPPQLRDLVVLKRNDASDANHHAERGGEYFITSDGDIYFWMSKWVKSTLGSAESLTATETSQPQDPTLISGDVALANVHKCIVQYLHDDEPYGRWTTITDHFWSQYHLGMFLDPDTKFKFRFKPQTIKLELELPKPFEPEEDCHVYILDDGKTDGYRRYSYEVHGDKGNTFIGIWKTEDEIKQVVAQLRKIRGTNS